MFAEKSRFRVSTIQPGRMILVTMQGQKKLFARRFTVDWHFLILGDNYDLNFDCLRILLMKIELIGMVDYQRTCLSALRLSQAGSQHRVTNSGFIQSV